MSKRIMIVDDAIFMRMKLKDIVEKNGYEVVAEAQNGAEAIEKYRAERPEIVTMDITMPEMNGIEALKGIRQIDPHAKVVMCSAMGQQAMVMEAIQAGATDFIVKPFETDRVLDSLVKASR
jgi:two-component system chemotaxis response regulator CheY